MWKCSSFIEALHNRGLVEHCSWRLGTGSDINTAFRNNVNNREQTSWSQLSFFFLPKFVEQAMRFISTSIFFAILAILLHVTAAAPPSPPGWLKRKYLEHKVNQHEKAAAKSDKEWATNTADSLDRNRKQLDRYKSEDMAYKAARERDRHIGKADGYRDQLEGHKPN